MWKNVVERGRPRLKTRHMRIECRIPKVTDTHTHTHTYTHTHTHTHTHTLTHTQYVILIAFPLQQRLYERASMLRYTYSTVQ
jgi:hypothetical protein